MSQNADSTVTQDYLKAVWALEEWGGSASVTALAKRMQVATSTASENVSRLVEMGLLVHKPYKPVTLSELGQRRALVMVRRHRILETFLVQELGFDWDEVHQEAEVLEHSVSNRLLERLEQRLGYPTRDPHGDPIPRADGTIERPALVRLAQLEIGQSAALARIADDAQLLRALSQAAMGLDCTLKLLARKPGPAGRQLAQIECQGRQLWVDNESLWLRLDTLTS